MTSYAGRHAELYDRFYADKPYEQEAEVVDRCLRAYADGPVKRILELACGTGSHALALEKRGYEIVATDYSKDMLDRARLKGCQSRSLIDFRLQDMRSLNLEGAPFDAAVCLFDSIGYVLTNEAIRNAFRGVHRHVRPGGLFVFEFWHAAAMLLHSEPLRVRRWATEEGEIVRISETNLDPSTQVCEVIYSIYELHRNGTFSNFRETQKNRFFLVQEMAALLSGTDFEPLRWFDGFSMNEAISDRTFHILMVARRRSD